MPHIRKASSFAIFKPRSIPPTIRLVLLIIALPWIQNPEARCQGARIPTPDLKPPDARPNPQPAARNPRLSDRALKIGYLLSGSDLSPVRVVLERLQRALMQNASLTKAMAEPGYDDIWLRQSDTPFDMIQRLQAREFELAFATSVIYALQFRPSPDNSAQFQQVGYEPILQFRDVSSDVFDPRGGVGRQGVVFIGPASVLWNTQPTDEQIRAELEREWMAVSDSTSAAGYIYPRLSIADRFGPISPRGVIFTGSSAEVVKHVLSGLINLGACESRILEGALGTIRTGAAEKPLYRELFRTALIPTDPILLRRDLLPEGTSAEAALGRELKAAIRAFFYASPSPVPGLVVENPNPRSYEDMARALRRFDSMDIQDEARQ